MPNFNARPVTQQTLVTEIIGSDVFSIVDVSDHTQSPSGTTKKCQISLLNKYIGSNFANTVVIRTPITRGISGTVTLTSLSTSVVGVGTSFNSEFEPLDLISFDNGVTTYSIASISNETHLTLTTNFTGNSSSGVAAYAAQYALEYITPKGSSGINGSGYFYVNETPAVPTEVPLVSGIPMFGGVVDNNPDTLMYSSKFYGTGQAPYVANFLARGTKASPTAVESGDVLIGFVGSGYDGTNYNVGGVMEFDVFNTVSSGVVPTALRIDLVGSTGSFGTRLSVTGDGAVDTLNNILDDGSSGASNFKGPLTIQQTVGTPATPSSGLTLFTNDGTTLKYIGSNGSTYTVTVT